MAGLKQQYNVRELSSRLESLKDFVSVQQKTRISELEKRRLSPGKYEATVEAVFPLNRYAEYVKWKEQIDLEFFPQFRMGARSKKKFPTKFRGIEWVDERNISDAVIFSEVFTKHADTLERLRDSLFLITTVTPFQHAASAAVSVDFRPHQNAKELLPFSVMSHKMEPTTIFGRMTTLNEENLNELTARYSDDKIAETIFYNIQPTNPLVKCLVERGEPFVVRYEHVDPEGNKKPLSFKSPEDVLEKVKGFKKTYRNGRTSILHAGGFYGSVDLIGSNHPSLLFVETDFGDLMKDSQWHLNASVEQSILDVLAENKIGATVQFSGYGGFHNLIGLRFSELAPTYLDILKKTLWENDSVEYSNYGLGKITAEVLGYLVHKRLFKEKGLRIVSIDPIRRWGRLFKILVDNSSNHRLGEYHLPGSTHLGSGAMCARLEIDGYELPKVAYDRKELMKFSQPLNLKFHVRSNPGLYLSIQTNNMQTIDEFVRKYRREYELMFWLRKKVERMQKESVSYPRDTVFFLNRDMEDTALKSLYGQTILDAAYASPV